MAILLDAWHHKVCIWTGQPGVSILRLDVTRSLLCKFYLSVAARTLVWADPSLRYTGVLLGRKATNQPTDQQTFLRTVDLVI